nr:hypothetical protein [Rhizobiaceae bacterium]
RGCLALLNGLSLGFLTEQQLAKSEDWQRAKALARECLPYLRLFQPADRGLEEGRDLLIASFTFIAAMSSNDVDEHSIPIFDTRAQGAWFMTNVVGDYFRSTAKLDFG